MINVSKIKPGDTITVKGTVSHYSQVGKGRICVSVGVYEELYIDVNDLAIVSHTPKPPEIVDQDLLKARKIITETFDFSPVTNRAYTRGDWDTGVVVQSVVAGIKYGRGLKS